MDKLVSIFESECRDQSDMITAGNDVQYRFRNGILTFQQSVSEQDWITNFSILPKKYNELIGHGGYIKSYQSVKDLVIGLNPRLIVGFSYGGPLAGLLHRDLKYFNSCSMDVPTIVFGCPKFVIYDRVNDWSGVLNVRNPYDLVSMVPPFPYHRVGNLLKLNNVKCIRDTSFMNWISGHSEREYVQRLGRIHL
jgi:hypothetical protein